VAPPAGAPGDATFNPERVAVLAAVAGGGVLVDGLVMGTFGTGALLPDGPFVRALPVILALAGAGVLAAALFRLPRDLVGPLGRSIPDLYPFGRSGSQLALFVLIVLGSVAFFQGTFESFTPAHAGGDLGSVPDQEAADALVVAAAILLWTLAAYTVLVVHRVIRLGRSTVSRGGRDVYGTSTEEPPVDLSSLGDRIRKVTPPPVPFPFVFLITLTVGFAASVAIQTAEVGTQPAPAMEWAWAQFVLPVWAGFVASGLSAVDRGNRGLERRVRTTAGASASRTTP
jgi:hypothetical protein